MAFTMNPTTNGKIEHEGNSDRYAQGYKGGTLEVIGNNAKDGHAHQLSLTYKKDGHTVMISVSESGGITISGDGAPTNFSDQNLTKKLLKSWNAAKNGQEMSMDFVAQLDHSMSDISTASSKHAAQQVAPHKLNARGDVDFEKTTAGVKYYVRAGEDLSDHAIGHKHAVTIGINGGVLTAHADGTVSINANGKRQDISQFQTVVGDQIQTQYRSALAANGALSEQELKNLRNIAQKAVDMTPGFEPPADNRRVAGTTTVALNR